MPEMLIRFQTPKLILSWSNNSLLVAYMLPFRADLDNLVAPMGTFSKARSSK